MPRGIPNLETTQDDTVNRNFRYLLDWILDFINTPEPDKPVIMTPEGGLAIRLTNDTGAASVKGSLVSASPSTDGSFILQNNEYDTIGSVYEDGVPNGNSCYVTVTGVADVLIKDNTVITRGHVAMASDVNGRAIGMAVPSGNPAQNDHWKEVGHFIEGCEAGTDMLCKAVLHFN